MGRRQKPSKGKPDRKRPRLTAGKSPKAGGARVRDLEKRLAEALKREAESLDQQKATSEILRIISRSPTNLQPVLDAIATNAALVCDAYDAVVFLREGDRLRTAAHYGPITITLQRSTLSRGSVAEVAILDRQPVHVHDVLATEPPVFPLTAEAARRGGFRTILSVPLLRENEAIGTLSIRRREVQPFTTQQIDLLKTFADQAVIAIENVRLFKELEVRNRDLTESLEQQTATSEILRVISSSPTDVQPVFDAIAQHAVKLCDARFCAVYRLDGEMLHLAASFNFNHEALALLQSVVPRPAAQISHIGRAIRERGVVNLADVAGTGDAPLGSHRHLARLAGYRGFMAVAMLHGDAPVGCIALGREEAAPFPPEQVSLIRTFADQAVIAIENVRLFTELQASNRELTTALDTQTATSDILRVISRSQTDVQPVFDAIVASAVRLLGAYSGGLTRVVGDQIALAAITNTDEAGDAAIRAVFPQSLQSEKPHAQAIRDRAPVNIADALTDPRLSEAEHALARARGRRSQVVVPLLRHDEAIGSIGVSRRQPGGFTGDEIALLQTFADQAVIAIENVRLFHAIEEKSRQLEAASQHKSEFLANMSHELRTPLNAIIGFSEVLSERMFGDLNEKQEEYLKDIYASGQHLLSLINDILDLSKIEAGRMELEVTEFDLPTAIDNALTLVRERAGRRGIRLERDVAETVGEVCADERKVKQVLLNLLSNAIKFTPEGGRIEIRADVKDGMAQVAVADTGVGIAPEDQEAVFEEFRQVGTADKKVEGTGLGLALSRKFIELHGGRIWVKSQVGQGSTFTFTIPVRGEPSNRGGAPTLNS